MLFHLPPPPLEHQSTWVESSVFNKYFQHEYSCFLPLCECDLYSLKRLMKELLSAPFISIHIHMKNTYMLEVNMKSKWTNYFLNTCSWSYYIQFISVLYSKGGKKGHLCKLKSKYNNLYCLWNEFEKKNIAQTFTSTLASHFWWTLLLNE